MSKFSLLNKFIVQEGKNEEMVDILLEAAESIIGKLRRKIYTIWCHLVLNRLMRSF